MTKNCETRKVLARFTWNCDDACSYGEHSWKFLLQPTQLQKS